MNNLFEKHLQNLLTIEGQIIYLLSQSDSIAGEIYKHVSASQPTVSKKLARLLDQGKICIETSQTDRRLSIYKLTDSYRMELRSENPYTYLTAIRETVGAQSGGA